MHAPVHFQASLSMQPNLPDVQHDYFGWVHEHCGHIPRVLLVPAQTQQGGLGGRALIDDRRVLLVPENKWFVSSSVNAKQYKQLINYRSRFWNVIAARIAVRRTYPHLRSIPTPEIKHPDGSICRHGCKYPKTSPCDVVDLLVVRNHLRVYLPALNIPHCNRRVDAGCA